jgi:hypothetical protein
MRGVKIINLRSPATASKAWEGIDAQKKCGPVAFGFVGSRRLRRARRRKLERRSSNRIAANRNGSASGADSREVNFDDSAAGHRGSPIFA